MKAYWLSVKENAEIKNGEIKFEPTKIDSTKSAEELENYHSKIVRSDTYFSSGEISMSIKITNAADKLQIVLGSDKGKNIIIGLNPDGYAYGIGSIDGSERNFLNCSGKGISPPVNEWINVKIVYIGSILTLYINSVVVAKSNLNFNNSQIEMLYRGMSECIVKDIFIKQLKPKAFVVMQFSAEFNSLYNEVIVPVCSDYGYEVIRADDMYTNGLIVNDIAQAIRESALIIADITPNNPNVYYEVGFSHGIEKETILLSDKNREKLPFDLSGFRLLFYENSIGGKTNVENSLRKHLEAIKNA